VWVRAEGSFCLIAAAKTSIAVWMEQKPLRDIWFRLRGSRASERSCRACSGVIWLFID
jgi:hypothetical protein